MMKLSQIKLAKTFNAENKIDFLTEVMKILPFGGIFRSDNYFPELTQ